MYISLNVTWMYLSISVKRRVKKRFWLKITCRPRQQRYVRQLVKKVARWSTFVAHQEWTSTKNLRAPRLVAGARRTAAVSLAIRRLLFISSAIHLHPHFFFSESYSCSEDISFLLWLQRGVCNDQVCIRITYVASEEKLEIIFFYIKKELWVYKNSFVFIITSLIIKV